MLPDDVFAHLRVFLDSHSIVKLAVTNKSLLFLLKEVFDKCPCCNVNIPLPFEDLAYFKWQHLNIRYHETSVYVIPVCSRTCIYAMAANQLLESERHSLSNWRHVPRCLQCSRRIYSPNGLVINTFYFCKVACLNKALTTGTFSMFVNWQDD